MTLLAKIISIICFLQFQWPCLATPIGNFFDTGHIAAKMPRIQKLDVKCARSGMTVRIDFDQTFPGVIFSKGHYYEPSCNYISQQTTSLNSFTFLIPIDSCGTSGNMASAAKEDMYFENIIIIQNDPLIQEIWDEARKLTCTWQHTLSKSVTTAPFSVQDPEVVSLQWDSRSIDTLMQIQKGSSPFSSPATGYISVGEEASIVIYVQENGQNLDANVVSCKVVTLKGDTVPLVDRGGCLLRPDLISPFYKMRKPNNVEADLMFFSSLKGFRVGESMDFTVSCQLEVCENSCLEPCALGKLKRKRRDAPLEEPIEEPNKKLLDLQRSIIIVSKPFENDTSKSECNLNQIAAFVVAILVVLFALLSALTSYLFLRLHTLQKQIGS